MKGKKHYIFPKLNMHRIADACVAISSCLLLSDNKSNVT